VELGLVGIHSFDATILKMLMRFVKPDSGDIFINGVEIEKFKIK
jgi:ABC-type proline/glycine betaine transport system ATPase subunit